MWKTAPSEHSITGWRYTGLGMTRGGQETMLVGLVRENRDLRVVKHELVSRGEIGSC